MTTGDFAGLVAAATPEAADAGVEILERGGNAVDAAVAVSLAIGVTEPAGSGIGGQATFIVLHPGEKPLVINGSSFAPSSIPADVAVADLFGHRATTVPSCLRVLELAWSRFGSQRLTWEALVKPAIRYATEGYHLGPFGHRALVRHAHAIRRSGIVTQFLLAADGSVPEPGSLVRQPILARTLRRIAERGAREFYTGALAREIVQDMAANGAWVTADDLAAVPEPPVVPPLSGTYRGWDVHTLPPPASGRVVLLALNLLECAPQGELATDGPRRLIWLAEMLRTAHRYRQRRPLADLSGYEQVIGRELTKEKAAKLVRSSLRAPSGETTHFSVVDGGGTAVGVTQSLNSYFGAKAAGRDLGFLYNDYMREFVLGSEAHPFALRPGAAPISFMSATALAREGRPVLVLGSPGDDRIISAVVQVISHWVDVGHGVENAVAAPRMHTLRGETLLLEEAPPDPDALVGLERRGYTIYRPLTSLFGGELNPYFGGVHAVAHEADGWRGAADPRRDGAVRVARRRP
jgi:gamma-glutamyltranspeptidase/glutathione hydrolase